MAEFEIRNGQGSMFKQQNDGTNKPDLKGKFRTPNGELFEFSAWDKGKYFSISIQEPFVKQGEGLAKDHYKNRQDAPPEPERYGNDLPNAECDENDLPF